MTAHQLQSSPRQGLPTARDVMRVIDQFLVKANGEMPARVTGPLEIMLRHASETPQDRSLVLECLYSIDVDLRDHHHKAKHYEQLTLILIKLQHFILSRRLADNGRKTIGIYFPSKAYREHAGTIAQRLREQGHQVIILVGEVCRDKYEADPEVYYGGHNAINDMNFLDAVICSTLTDGLPKNAKQILMVHDIHDTPVGDEDAFFRLLRLVDYACLPSRHVVELFRGIAEPRKSQLPAGKHLHLIPNGYIKLDRTLAHCQRNKQCDPVIIYAPTIIDIGLDHLVSLPAHGDIIVDKILREFPDHVLVFRPHPHTLHMEPTRRIADQFSQNPRFCLDTAGSDYLDLYSRSALMVTDMSGTAYTYAMATLRPVVFFSHEEEAVTNQFAESHYFADRNRVGTVVKDTQEMTDEIRRLLSQPDHHQQNAKAYRDQLIYNVGHAEDYLIDHFDYILAGESHPTWVTI